MGADREIGAKKVFVQLAIACSQIQQAFLHTQLYVECAASRINRIQLGEGMEFLTLYAEVCLGWVAFTAIVATLRQALGGHFTPLQYVMFRYFVESSLLFFMITLVSIALHETLDEEAQSFRITVIVMLLSIAIYTPFHVHRRIRLGVSMPMISLATIIGYVVLGILLLLSLFDVWVQPTLGIIAATMVYSLGANTLIFVQFLGSFVEVKGT